MHKQKTNTVPVAVRSPTSSGRSVAFSNMPKQLLLQQVATF